jgi:hypothetical protein
MSPLGNIFCPLYVSGALRGLRAVSRSGGLVRGVDTGGAGSAESPVAADACRHPAPPVREGYWYLAVPKVSRRMPNMLVLPANQ